MKRFELIIVLLVALLAGGGFDPSSLATEPSALPPAESKTHSFGEAELKQLLTGVLQRDHVQDKGELELRFTRAWTAVSVPDEPIALKVIELPTAGVTPNFIVRFELSTASRVIGAFQVPVTAQIRRAIWVARSPLRRGEPLDGCDRLMERRDMLALRDAAWNGATDASSLYELAENIPAGCPIYQRSVKLRTLVRRGQIVEALVRDEAMTVSLKAEVLEDGALGQQVRVRNLHSKREFRGKVQDEKTVLVSL